MCVMHTPDVMDITRREKNPISGLDGLEVASEPWLKDDGPLLWEKKRRRGRYIDGHDFKALLGYLRVIFFWADGVNTKVVRGKETLV